MVLIYRGLILDEGNDGHEKLLARKQRRLEKLGETPSTWKILKFYAPRLIGTGGAWFVWDIAFYGLKRKSLKVLIVLSLRSNTHNPFRSSLQWADLCSNQSRR